MTAALVLPDPGVAFGAYRVLPCAEGGFIIVDERLALGARTVARAASLNAATEIAREFAAADAA